MRQDQWFLNKLKSPAVAGLLRFKVWGTTLVGQNLVEAGGKAGGIAELGTRGDDRLVVQ